MWACAIALALASAPELMMPPGSQGAVFAYRLAGPLGPSGLTVTATPTMLLVTAIAPGSPAALSDVPSPEAGRVRLAAVNGHPVEALSRDALLRAFNPQTGAVQLTFALKGDGGERLLGPYTVPLASQAIAEQKARWLAEGGRFDEAVALVKSRETEREDVAQRLLVAAEQAARAGDHEGALRLGVQFIKLRPQDAAARHRVVAWRRSAIEDRLQRADRLADAGNFKAALAALSAVPAESPWKLRRDERSANWRAALAQQSAYRKAQADEAKKKAADARRRR